MSSPPYPAPDPLRLQDDRLAALHVVALSLTSTLELSQVLQRVLEMAQSLSQAVNANIFLYNAERDDLYLAASHWSAQEQALPLNPRRGGVTYTVAHTGQPTFIENTAHHPAYADSGSWPWPGALACLPLVKGQRVLGTLNLGYWQPHTFDDDTRAFLDLMARHAAIAIEQARLMEDSVQKARLERELELARQLQASLIPRRAPRLDGYDFGTLWRPARLASGDFYDFVPSVSGKFQNIVIADVSDKGMSAALFMALARSSIRGSINDGCCPSDALEHANRVLFADSFDGMFVTAVFAQLEPASGQVIYVNAGHNPPLLYRAAPPRGDAARRAFTQLTLTGVALAVDDRLGYTQSSVRLQPGDFIFLYTDGITEALNADQEEFGLDRFQQAILAHCGGAAQDMIAGVEQAVDAFVGDSPPFDDMTAVVVKRNA